METNNITIEQMFDGMDNNIIKKVKDSPLKGIIFLIMGIAFIFVNTVFSTSSSSIASPLFIMLAFAFIIWGMLSIFIRKSFYVKSATAEKIIFKELYFDENESEKLMKMIETGNFDGFNKISQTVDRGIKLRIAYSKDKNFCYVQALKYVPFEYIIKSNAIELSPSQANVLLNSI